jgi:ribosomal protein S18 acetylase RimI-like enzyme
MRIAIEEGSASDLDDALDLDVRAHRARCSNYAPPDDLRKLLNERLKAPQAHFLIATFGGELVGTVISSVARAADGRPVPGFAHISFVAVEPKLWGAGIAKRLMLDIEQRLRDEGFEAVQLWVREEDPRALALYRHLDYEPTGDARDSHDGEWIVRLAKRL